MFHEWHRLGVDMFLGPVLGTGVNVPSSVRARRSSQSGSLPREGPGHNVLPEGAPSQEQHVGLQPCDRAAAQVTADMASRRIRAGLGAPVLGPLPGWSAVLCSTEGGPQEQPRQPLSAFYYRLVGKD